MSYITNYHRFRTLKEQSKEWYEMLGKPYHGGGGGTGKVTSLELSKCEIYFQSHNGAQNYHSIPPDFKKYIEKAIIKNFTTILKDAEQMQEEDFKKVAEQAVGEAKSILQSAGVYYELPTHYLSSENSTKAV